MKKVIILYSTGGMGHKKAAIALFQAFQDRGGDVEVLNVDTLDYANRFYKFLYLDMYIFFMTRARKLWGILYDLFDKPFMDRLLRGARGSLDLKSLDGLEDMLLREKPDAIITTHFILPAIAGKLKEHEDFLSKLYVVVTDYGPHSFWLSDDVDKFFVGAERIIPLMEKRGVPPEKITATGIPAVREFTHGLDAEELRRKYELDPDRKTIFMLSGGFGVGPMAAMLASLCSSRSEIQVITVCGHNETAYNNINDLRPRLDYPVKLFGFTDKVAELMAVSDLMVTKAGGISVTEAMDMRLPMILYASIPGQESWNEELLVESGAAKKAKSIDDIPRLVDEILLNEQVYKDLKDGIEKIRRPHAAEDIVKTVLDEIE